MANPARPGIRFEVGFYHGKKIARILRKIRGVRGLAASPDERWQMHENFLRSHDLFTRSSRKKYGFK
jgi:hypothetical protein